MSDAPTPPNYQPLIDAAVGRSNNQDKWGRENQDFFKKLYDKYSGMTDAVIDAQLGQMDKQIGYSDRFMQRYQQYGEPLEEQLFWEAENYASPERLEAAAGEAETNVAQKMQIARNTALENLEKFGVDPSQTRANAMDLDLLTRQASAQAQAGNVARRQAEQTGRDIRGQAIDVARGLSAASNQNAQLGAGMGQTAANTGLAQTASAAQTLGTNPTWQQIANASLATGGNLMNASFNNQMDKWKADESSSSGFGDILGTVAGLATMFIQEGGAVPDEGEFIPPEASPSGGAIPDDVEVDVAGSDGEVNAKGRINAGEFIVPKDVVSWLGEKGMQQLILKARKEMTGANGERPAQPEVAGGPPPPTMEGAGIPMPA